MLYSQRIVSFHLYYEISESSFRAFPPLFLPRFLSVVAFFPPEEKEEDGKI